MRGTGSRGEKEEKLIEEEKEGKKEKRRGEEERRGKKRTGVRHQEEKEFEEGKRKVKGDIKR